MADEKRELIRQAATTLLEHEKAGRVVDPHSVLWARRVLAWPAMQEQKPGTSDNSKATDE